MPEIERFEIGRGSPKTVVFTDLAISYQGQSMLYSDIRSVAWWVSETQGRIYDTSKGELRIKTQDGVMEIIDVGRGFHSTSEKIKGFATMLLFAKRIIVPILTKYYLTHIFKNHGELCVDNLRITHEGIFSKSIFGEKFCRWEWLPATEQMLQGNRWYEKIAPQSGWEIQSLVYFYNPSGKKIELGRLFAHKDNATIALELINHVSRLMKGK